VRNALALPLTDEQKRNPIYVIPPAQRPRVVLRYADTVWRGETRGSYSLVRNAILSFDSLDVGRKATSTELNKEK
jgi:hypothetical protein